MGWWGQWEGSGQEWRQGDGGDGEQLGLIIPFGPVPQSNATSTGGVLWLSRAVAIHLPSKGFTLLVGGTLSPTMHQIRT